MLLGWRTIIGHSVTVVIAVSLAIAATACQAQFVFAEYPVPTAGFPRIVTVGSDGNLWFTYTNIPKVGRITTAGVITEFSVQADEGITAGPDGNLWFTEYFGQKIGRITTAGVITEFPLPNGGYPFNITAGPDGNLWFAERFGNAIGRITTAGVITEFSVPTSGSQPLGITSGPDGNLWFTEAVANKIGRITPAGVITEFSLPNAGNPYVITSGPDGNLWFTENVGNRIGRISPTGVIAEFTLPTPGSWPASITSVRDGNLWFTTDVGQIGTITTAGAITMFSAPSPGRMGGITQGPDGNVWFLEGTANKIVKAILADRFFRPDHGGNTGNVTVKFVTAFDFPVADGTTVTLRDGVNPDISISASRVSDYVLTMTFDLRNAPVGVRDVVIDVPSGGTRTYPQVFTVEAGNVGTVWADIIGRRNPRIGALTHYSFVYGNGGNVNSLSPITVFGPSSAELFGPDFPLAAVPTTLPTPVDLSTVSAGISVSGVTSFALLPPPVPPGLPFSLSFSTRLRNPGRLGITVCPPATDCLGLFGLSQCESDVLQVILSGASIPLPCLPSFATWAMGVYCNWTSLTSPNASPLSLWQVFVGGAASLAYCVPGGNVAGIVANLFNLFPSIYTAWQDCSKCGQQTVLDVTPLASIDPNALSGQPGYSSLSWLSGSQPLSYIAQFENLSTATAPAADVIIVDHLDPTALDLTAVTLRVIRFGDHVVTPTEENSPPVGMREFNAEVPLPDRPLTVVINAKVDMLTGDLTWHLIARDADGNMPPADPTAGFLDPGVGGSVLFSVLPKKAIPTGTVVTNQAEITFDYNAPLPTNTWSNTLDSDPPVSKVAKLAATQTTSKFTVKWPLATDIGSGVKDYTIYVSDSNGPYQPWLTNTTLTQASFTGIGGHSYRFYSVARDNAYNLEPAPAGPDAYTTVKLCPDHVALNPATVPGSLPSTGTVVLTGPAPSGGALVALISANTSLATVPATVTVPAGQTTADFQIATTAVAAKTAVKISAKYNLVTKGANLTVRPIGVASVTLNPSTVKGGNPSTGTVTLEAPAAPGDITVTLTSSSTAATVTSPLVIRAGQPSGPFTINTTAVTSTKYATIKATANAIYKTAKLTVTK